jgi:hypothetical protein
MKRINNRNLIIILTVLILLFVVARVFRAPLQKRNIPEVLVEMDSAKINRIEVIPESPKQDRLILEKNKMQWTISDGNKKVSAENQKINSALLALMQLKPRSLATKNRQRWGNFEVTDSSFRVIAYASEDVIADLRIGKTGFDQSATNTQNPFYGGMANAYTYVRLQDGEDVYAVDGFLKSSFGSTMNDWRDQSFLRLTPYQIDQINFSYPDSSFVLDKNNGKWNLNNISADSIEVESFLRQLAFLDGNDFEDDYSPASNQGDFSVSFSQGKIIKATIQAWRNGNLLILNSSTNPETYFSDKNGNLFASVFRPRNKFLSAKGRGNH